MTCLRILSHKIASSKSTTKTANLMIKMTAVVNYLLSIASLGRIPGAVSVGLWYLMEIEEGLFDEVARICCDAHDVAKLRRSALWQR